MSKDSLHIGGGERMQFEEISKEIMSWENSHNDGGESMEFDIFAKHFYCGIIHMPVAVKACILRTFSNI